MIQESELMGRNYIHVEVRVWGAHGGGEEDYLWDTTIVIERI
jgi:hypothetical protein